MTDTELIAHYGGPAKFARLLRLEGVKGVRRVCNWQSRGIQPIFKLNFPEVFAPQRTAQQEAGHA